MPRFGARSHCSLTGVITHNLPSLLRSLARHSSRAAELVRAGGDRPPVPRMRGGTLTPGARGLGDNPRWW
jgi:hypothetical protein